MARSPSRSMPARCADGAAAAVGAHDVPGPDASAARRCRRRRPRRRRPSACSAAPPPASRRRRYPVPRQVVEEHLLQRGLRPPDRPPRRTGCGAVAVGEGRRGRSGASSCPASEVIRRMPWFHSGGKVHSSRMRLQQPPAAEVLDRPGRVAHRAGPHQGRRRGPRSTTATCDAAGGEFDAPLTARPGRRRRPARRPRPAGRRPGSARVNVAPTGGRQLRSSLSSALEIASGTAAPPPRAAACSGWPGSAGRGCRAGCRPRTRCRNSPRFCRIGTTSSMKSPASSGSGSAG